MLTVVILIAATGGLFIGQALKHRYMQRLSNENVTLHNHNVLLINACLLAKQHLDPSQDPVRGGNQFVLDDLRECLQRCGIKSQSQGESR